MAISRKRVLKVVALLSVAMLTTVREIFSLANNSVAFHTWKPDIPFSGTWVADPICRFFWISTSFQVSRPEASTYTYNIGVGKFQGREALIVFLSFCASDATTSPLGIGFCLIVIV